MKSYIIDVQRCSIHDGPGIRTTVFLKGCPLRCKWCHNPESQSFSKELSFNSKHCIFCDLCVPVCPNGVHQVVDKQHIVAFSKCKQCGMCTKHCPNKALTMVGKEMTPQEVYHIVKKDKVFYEHSQGGITLSGGEALSHIDFCVELLQYCKTEGIHTCVETSGYSTLLNLQKVIPLVDLFLFDYKISREAESAIGVSLETIHRSFEYIYNEGKAIILRCPIIPGINDTKEHFDAIADRIKQYPNIVEVQLLPYHDFGISKGNNIGKPSERFEFPTQEQKEAWLDYFQSQGYSKVKCY